MENKTKFETIINAIICVYEDDAKVYEKLEMVSELREVSRFTKTLHFLKDCYLNKDNHK